jgi:hypothetical protein
MDDIVERQAAFEMIEPSVVYLVRLPRSVLERLLDESLEFGLGLGNEDDILLLT